MPETLLYQSRILLFGQLIEDLKLEPSLPPDVIEVRAATVDESDRDDVGIEDGVNVVANDRVLVKDQDNFHQNGIHTVIEGGGWNRNTNTPNGSKIYVHEGDINGGSLWILTRKPPEGGNNPRYIAERYERPAAYGQNKQLADQFFFLGAALAKIYGFSYEGSYYDLPRPTLFMVHGDGEQITEDDLGLSISNVARAPRKPSDIGLSVADFQFSDEIRVWSYDKADYTIRMDVETGMYEELLLEAEMDEEAIEPFYSGQRARLSGQRARVSGQRVRVSGQRVRIRDRGD